MHRTCMWWLSSTKVFWLKREIIDKHRVRGENQKNSNFGMESNQIQVYII